MRETVAQPAPYNRDGILKNTTTAVSLQYFSNFWKSLEMQLIHCKVVNKVLSFSCGYC